MSTLFTKTFWKDAGERAIKSSGQGILLALGGGAVAPNAITLDWLTVGGAGLGAALLSLVTSIASAGIGNNGTASLIPSGDTRA